MNIYQSYTYQISWTTHNKHYYGVRFAKNCHPGDLWTSYFTSSRYVKEFREKYGEPDIVKIDKTFDAPQDAIDYEATVLNEKYDSGEWDSWLNKRTGNAIIHDADTIARGVAARAGRVISDITKQRMSDTRQLMAASGIGVGENNPMYGRRATADWSEKLSDSSKRKNKTIYTFVHNDGNEFTGTMSDFYKTYNLSRTWVSRIIKGEKQTIKGWKLIT